VVPAGTRIVQMVAEYKGVVSEVLQVPVNWDNPPEDKALPDLMGLRYHINQ